MKEQRLVERSLSLASLFIIYQLVTAAFSYRSKGEIKHRAKYCCEECAEKGKFKTARRYNLEASHIDHARGRNYNNPENGKLLCVPHHYVYHLTHRGNATAIGLSEHDNDWAIDTIWERMSEGERLESTLMLRALVQLQTVSA